MALHYTPWNTELLYAPHLLCPKFPSRGVLTMSSLVSRSTKIFQQVAIHFKWILTLPPPHPSTTPWPHHGHTISWTSRDSPRPRQTQSLLLIENSEIHHSPPSLHHLVVGIYGGYIPTNVIEHSTYYKSIVLPQFNTHITRATRQISIWWSFFSCPPSDVSFANCPVKTFNMAPFSESSYITRPIRVYWSPSSYLTGFMNGCHSCSHFSFPLHHHLLSSYNINNALIHLIKHIILQNL